MSVAPVMPVVTGTNLARSLPWASLSTTKTPCTGFGFAAGVAADAACTPPLLLALSVAGSCMVSAWMGSESTFGLCAVVILAVVERPGRSSSDAARRA